MVRAFAHGASLWVVGSILHGVDPLSYFSLQPVLHDWCNKGCGMCYPVCGMVHIKELLLLIRKSSLCFLSHYQNGPKPYVWRHITVNKNASLNETFPSFLPEKLKLTTFDFIRLVSVAAVVDPITHLCGTDTAWVLTGKLVRTAGRVGWTETYNIY